MRGARDACWLKFKSFSETSDFGILYVIARRTIESLRYALGIQIIDTFIITER